LINRRKDGTHYLEGQTITPVCDEDGTVRHFIAVKQDITERKRAENALQESEARLQATLDAIPDLLFEVGLDGRYHACHSRCSDLLAAPPEQLLGKLVSDVMPPDAADIAMAALQEANESGHSIGKQIALRLPQGKKWFELSIARKSSLPNEDPRFIVLSRDITERKLSEKRMEELSRHLVVVQESARRRLSGELHDRTSPNLAAIGVNLDIMAETMREVQSPVLSDRLEDVRALIEDTTASIREICSDLRPPVLDYAGLAAALDSYVKQFQRRTGIPVRIDGADPGMRLPPALESVLFRIVQEALTNCAKHSRAKSFQVMLRLGGAPVSLTVSDDGIGFDPDSLGKTTHTSGLGILTMREMAEFSGGKFILESVPGKGTRITVEIHSMEGQA
jgi:PAS domain S-box-containing protein